jgi:hypothetical protein
MNREILGMAVVPGWWRTIAPTHRRHCADTRSVIYSGNPAERFNSDSAEIALHVIV